MTKFGYTVLTSIGIWAAVLLLSGCQLGSTVMFSQGEAGGLVEMWGGQANFCKLTATQDVELSEQTILEFAKKCQSRSD